MVRPLLLLLAVALVAGAALWTLGAGDGPGGARDPAVVHVGPEPAGAQAARQDLAGGAHGAHGADTTPLLLTVDPLTAARAGSARRASSVPRLDRVDRALLRWDDGSPVADALVDVAAGPLRKPYEILGPDDPPAVRSDAEGRLRFRQLYAGRPHLAIISHPDLLGVAAVAFAVPGPGETAVEQLELVVPRPSTLVVEGLDWPERMALRLAQRHVVGESRPGDSAGATVLSQRWVEGQGSLTFEGLARGTIVELTLVGEDGVPRAEARVMLEQDVERVSLAVVGTQPVGQSRGFSWRLVDGRGKVVTLTRMREAGLATQPEVTLVGAASSASAGTLEVPVAAREQAELGATGDRYAGVLRTRLEPPWRVSLSLHGRRLEAADVEPGDEVELVLPDELMPGAGARVRFVSADDALALGSVQVMGAAGLWRDVDVRSASVGEPLVGRLVLPPGEYSWRARDRDLRLSAEGLLSVSATDADLQAERELRVRFGATSTLTGTATVLGADDGVRPLVMLVEPGPVWRPDLAHRAFAMGDTYRVEYVAPGDYEILVIVQRDGRSLSLPAGAITLEPGEQQRDLVVSVPDTAGQRPLAVSSPLATDGWLALSDGRGRRIVYLLALRAWRRAEDERASWSSLWQPATVSLAVPPGFDRYEAWAQAQDGGWWRATGTLRGDKLELVPDPPR